MCLHEIVTFVTCMKLVCNNVNSGQLFNVNSRNMCISQIVNY